MYAFSAAVGMPSMALAQASAEDGEVVVTAEGVGQSIQRVAVAITAISGDQLKAAQIDNVTALAENAPGLVFKRTAQVSQLTIRGIGRDTSVVSSDPGIALNVNGVNIGRSIASGVAMLDPARVEVLRGPQGALYGATGGGGERRASDRSAMLRLRALGAWSRAGATEGSRAAYTSVTKDGLS